MRLPLRIALSCCVLAIGCAGQLTHKPSARVHVYDDPRLSVISPTVRDEISVGDARVAADYAVDAVSAATAALTVDAVSSATHFTERRHQAGVSAALALASQSELSAGYGLSLEPDHRVHAPSIGLTHELLHSMVRASLHYQLVAEAIGRTGAASLDAHALGHRVDLGWTQILTPTLSLTGLLTGTAYRCSDDLGCFANPYRYVGVAAAGGDTLALSERHPSERFTFASALRAAWALSSRSALHAGYRLSQDSWRVTAHTGDVSLAVEILLNVLLVRLEGRATAQSAASFYRQRYRTDDRAAPAYRTADAELSALWNVRLQLHLEWTLGPIRIVGQLGRLWSQYPNFRSLPERHALLAGLGIDGEL